MAQENANRDVLRILIVDDVEENRFVLRDIIRDMGYLPILTENGVQALKMIERFHPQLIISDVAMPQMDGYEFCRHIKENAETRDIPIVFISAFDDPSDIVQGFNLGGEDYITKPFIPEVVKARVGLHLKLAETNRNRMEINRQLHVSVNEQLRQIEIEKKNILYALVRVERENVCYDEQHMERLSYNCRLLAEAMQLSADYGHLISDSYIETMGLAAPLCDLGNVALPTDILQKTGEWSDEERSVMQSHTTVGAQILRDIKREGDYNDFLQVAIDIANYHHENWDGSGYPCGLSGQDIPLAAQIVAVVNEYCALTENTGEREAYDGGEALAQMETEVGTVFSPDIFQILRKIYRQLR